MSPLSRLARQMRVKEKTAWDFFLEVKKEFPKKSVDISTITNCIVQNKLSKPTPQTIVNILKGRGNTAETGSPGSVPPPKPKRGDDPGLGVKNKLPAPKPKPGSDSNSAQATYKKLRQKNPSTGSSAYSGKNGALRSERDTRNFNKQIPRCRHGILKTKLCAICNPKQFALVNGQD